jgi:uncharacterized protein involved in exopolysaccharide biosynthesis
MPVEPTNQDLSDQIDRLAAAVKRGLDETAKETAKNFERTWRLIASVQSQVSNIESQIKTSLPSRLEFEELADRVKQIEGRLGIRRDG